MNKYMNLLNHIARDKKMNEEEKIESLNCLLDVLEDEYQKLENEFKENIIEKGNRRLNFYNKQMLATTCAAVISLATAMHLPDISAELNHLLHICSSVVATLGIGTMAVEELGVPFFKNDRIANDLEKITKARTKLEKLLAEKQSQPQ